MGLIWTEREIDALFALSVAVSFSFVAFVDDVPAVVGVAIVVADGVADVADVVVLVYVYVSRE